LPKVISEKTLRPYPANAGGREDKKHQRTPYAQILLAISIKPGTIPSLNLEVPFLCQNPKEPPSYMTIRTFRTFEGHTFTEGAGEKNENADFSPAFSEI
jgi:hypothetical protein